MASIKDLKRMCNYYDECDVCPLENSRCHHIVSSLPDNANTETCVCCGAEIPEGRQVCPVCENREDK